MAKKQVYAIRDFSGGLITARPNTELRPGEFSVFRQVIGDRGSFIRALGDRDILCASQDTSSSYNVGTFSNGYGLKVVHSDYNYATTTTASCAPGATELIFIATASGVSIFDVTTASTTYKYPKQYTGIQTEKPDMYVVDGKLRISDSSEFNTSNSPKVFGYIERELIQTNPSTYASSILGWYLSPAGIISPDGGVFTASATEAETVSAQEVNILAEYSSASKEGYDWDKEWEAAVSFIYDSNQESLLVKLTGTTSTSSDDESCKFTCYVKPLDGVGGDFIFNERITAINLYVREVGTSDWLLQSVFDLVSGAVNPTNYDGGMSEAGGGGVPL